MEKCSFGLAHCPVDWGCIADFIMWRRSRTAKSIPHSQIYSPVQIFHRSICFQIICLYNENMPLEQKTPIYLGLKKVKNVGSVSYGAKERVGTVGQYQQRCNPRSIYWEELWFIETPLYQQGGGRCNPRTIYWEKLLYWNQLSVKCRQTNKTLFQIEKEKKLSVLHSYFKLIESSWICFNGESVFPFSNWNRKNVRFLFLIG